ncbi:hypothetical protein SAMN05421766_102550 [Zobellia uliginosa]|uniref:Uncharacterized protein n=1 Tax=Zobellia uliginosa TaxID=143224 RepID=A0ABY1KN75_9FLAO|nr:hypothetical protein SAMN05421766_102550 [Zobellia uliginosa]
MPLPNEPKRTSNGIIPDVGSVILEPNLSVIKTSRYTIDRNNKG